MIRQHTSQLTSLKHNDEPEDSKETQEYKKDPTLPVGLILLST